MKCSWLHCGASFKDGSPLPRSWRLVARQLNTGEEVVLCPEHVLKAGEAELVLLLKLLHGRCRRVEGDDTGPEEVMRPPLKGRVRP